MMPLSIKPILDANQLNSSCRCVSLNHQAMAAELWAADSSGQLSRLILEERPQLFAESAVFVDQSNLDQQLAIIAALERVIAMPAYQQQVLAHAPTISQFEPKAAGVFIGYDFHLAEDGPKLIEINSNAGGAMINALLIRAQDSCCDLAEGRRPGKLPGLNDQQPESLFMAMFNLEWRSERGDQSLQRIAIVDDEPQQQYMLPEFMLFKHLFEQHGIDAVICDPAELEYSAGTLWHKGQKIDLVYNRLTDFGLTAPNLQALREAYLANAVVLTPHPRNHALYADKRNLIALSDDAFLASIAVDEATRAILRHGVAQTIAVDAQQAENLWAQRKQLFFKPAKGYGSKAVYRGDKMTRRVFNEILQHDYIAQTTIKPSERQLEVAAELVDLKLDVRHYVYRGQTQLVCARLYQGQTTNFRTQGGGFAQVLITGQSSI